jgi:hypothetical protein
MIPMADIQITDNVDLSADLSIRDDSPLAKAKLTKLVATAKQLFDDFSKPIDQADERSIALGGSFTSPSFLSSDITTLTVGGGMNCGVSILKAADKLLFPDDGFSPIIPIQPNQAWIGVDFDLTATAQIGAAANGLGVSLEADAVLACSTYTQFSTSGAPLPLLRDGCATAFSNFSLTTSAAAIRSQLVQTVNVSDATGSATLALSIEQPFSLNALASANLPFNKTASIQPDVTLELTTSFQVAGEFLVRCYKISQDAIRIGLYKKPGSTLAVTLTAGVGVGGDIGSDDVLGALLNKVLPDVDVTAAGITGDNAKNLNAVIKAGLERNLSAQLNATCSASVTDEAAMLYNIQLNEGDSAATDAALTRALRGDWTVLESLPNAHRLRNITVETKEKKLSVTVNLLGFYSATSTMDYLKSCQILLDESGQITITDKLNATRIQATTSPYAADSDKLRQALIEDFLCTATYAVVGDRLNLTLSVMQSYFDYKRNMSSEEMQQNILLGHALDVIPEGSLDGVLRGTPSFHHACVNAIVRYDTPALLHLFYKDAASQAPRSNDEIETVGRIVMCTLLDPSDDTDAVRIDVLENDQAWAQMSDFGNIAGFGDIPYLSHLSPNQLAAVSGDWVSIAWWATALSKIAPALTATTAALDAVHTGDPTKDPAFMKARDKLANVLGAVTRNTDAAFVHGWGAAVMFALSGGHGSREMDLTWDGKTLHYAMAAGS